MLQIVTTYYLEMTDRGELRPKRIDRPGLQFRRVEPPNPDVNRSFYRDVGQNWKWIDRLVWTDEQWKSYAERPELQTWIARVDGAAAGYAELERQADGNVQIR